MTTKPIRLALKGIEKSFPGIKALNGVSFEVRHGEVHGLLGENGAGKSTLLNILSAVLSANQGQISIDGAAVQLSRPADARAAGIAMIHQELRDLKMSFLTGKHQGSPPIVVLDVQISTMINFFLSLS